MNVTERSFTARVPEDLYQRLREQAEREHRSLSSVVRIALWAYLAADEKR